MQERSLVKQIILQIPACQATAKAPLGPILGQLSISIPEFCELFNKESEIYVEGTIVNCMLKIYDDESYQLNILQPNIIEFIKQALNIKKLVPCKHITIEDDITNNHIISAGMLIEILYNYLGHDVTSRIVNQWFKRLISQLRQFGIITIVTE